MSRPVLAASKLCKVYPIGELRTPHGSLREAITTFVGRVLHSARGDARKPRFRAEHAALTDVSFEVRPGQVVGVVGRNGAGKSTLLKILARITHPTSGRYSVSGRVASLLEVGAGFHPELTGRDNIFLNGAMLGMRRSEIRGRFDEIVEFAQVGEFLDTPVKRYSSGMYVRLAFAVAAHLECDVLLIDEVLAVGDVEFQRKCLGQIGTSARNGRAVLFVSHNMSAIRTLCQEAILLESGRLTKFGPVEEVIQGYLRTRRTVGGAVARIPDLSTREAASYKEFYACGEDGQYCSSFRIGETITVVARVVLRGISRSVVVAAFLESIEGVGITTHWSLARDCEPGEYQAIFRFRLLLAAGDYVLSTGLSAHEQQLAALKQAVTVTVEPACDSFVPVRASGCGVLVSVERPVLAEVGPMPSSPVQGADCMEGGLTQ